MALTLGLIVKALPAELHGDPSTLIQGIAPLDVAGPGDISFLSNPKYHAQLPLSEAACVIVAPPWREAAIARGASIITDQPYLYFAHLTQWWKKQLGVGNSPGIHPSAVVDANAEVDASASVGPLCVVERGARIGAGTVLKSRVTLGAGCVIGARCIVHPGVVIGADGFGFAPNQGAW